MTTHDDDLVVVDDEEAPPLWFLYAVLIDGTNNHDKFYELSISLEDDGTYVLSRRWGRRPDTLHSPAGQTKREPFRTFAGARSEARHLWDQKMRKGYREAERGY